MNYHLSSYILECKSKHKSEIKKEVLNYCVPNIATYLG